MFVSVFLILFDCVLEQSNTFYFAKINTAISIEINEAVLGTIQIYLYIQCV